MNDYQKEKIANFVAFFTKNLKFCGITKLYKVMSFADFEHFRQTGKSISGLDYIAYPYGPYPIELNNQIRDPHSFFGSRIKITKAANSKLNSVITNIEFNKKYFSDRELKIMDNMIFIFRDIKTDDIVKASHEAEKPWRLTLQQKGQYKKIDLALVLNNSPDSITSEEYERLKKEEKEFKAMFNE